MEQTRQYQNKLSSLQKAVTTFEKSMMIDTASFSDIEQDTIKSGQIQKFEVSVELFWKTIKKFLYEIHGIEAVSPKMVIKQLYRTNYIDEKNYEGLIEMINDRNRMSHVYNEDQFAAIYCRLPEYLLLMKQTMDGIG